MRLNGIQNKAFVPATVLETAGATLANGARSGVQKPTFPAFFESFAAADEHAVAVAAAKEPTDADTAPREATPLGSSAKLTTQPS